MNRASQQQLKLAVLEVIKSKKETLFASFQNNAVTKIQKEAGWQEVLIKAQAVGLAKDKHDWMYARDKLFGLWKWRTLAKRDNARKTGTSGGKAAKLDDVDQSILDIIGTDSPVVNGLDLPETGGDPGLVAQAERDRQARLLTHTNINAKKKRLRTVSANESELNRLKKELLRTEIYKNKLEILKLENELGLPCSKYTKKFENASNEESVSVSSTEEGELHVNAF